MVLGKYVEGHLKTHEVIHGRQTTFFYPTITHFFYLFLLQDWAFVARFCFLSGRGRYEYHIEYERRLGVPQLLLYYDDESQWPSVYKRGKSCLQKVSVLRPIDNQVVPLTTKRPGSYLSGCRMTTSRDRLRPPPSSADDATTQRPDENASSSSTISDEVDSSYFEQFLKSSSTTESPTITSTTFNPTTTPLMDTEDSSGFSGDGSAFEEISLETDADVFNVTDEEQFILLARDNDGLQNGNRLENDSSFQAEVEELFSSDSSTEKSVRVRRSPLWPRENTGTIIVSCSNAGGFTSVRERWWYIAISNCGSDKGIDIKYKFRMTNGPPGDFWHEHFSADEMCKITFIFNF